MTPEKIKMQIKAINSQIKAGKVKNVYSAQGKIKALKIAYLKAKQEHSWNNYLAN
jgi:ribosomal protein L23